MEIYEDESSDQILINYTEEGHKFKIGIIECQRNCCGDSFVIVNERNQVIFSITQTASNGCKISCKFNCEDCQNVDFEILSDAGKFLSKFKKVNLIS